MSKRTRRILAIIGVIIAIVFIIFITNPDLIEIFNSGTIGN
jgi:hypothetical protein